MNQSPEKIGSFLKQGRNTQLLASEKNDMLRELQAYANYHPIRPHSPVQTAASRSLFRLTAWLSTAAAVLVVGIGTGYASTYSMPGEILYPVKVGIVEEVVGLTRFSDSEQLEYKSKLMEKRLAEMQTLVKEKKLTELETSILEIQIAEHGTDISELIQNDSDHSIPATQSLETLSDAVANLRTQAFIEDTNVSRDRLSKIDSTEDIISALYDDQVNEFVTADPEQVTDYIEQVLDEVQAKIDDDQTEVIVTSMTELKDYLTDVTDSLEDGDVLGALRSMGAAEQLIEFNTNLEELNHSTEEESEMISETADKTATGTSADVDDGSATTTKIED